MFVLFVHTPRPVPFGSPTFSMKDFVQLLDSDAAGLVGQPAVPKTAWCQTLFAARNHHHDCLAPGYQLNLGSCILLRYSFTASRRTSRSENLLSISSRCVANIALIAATPPYEFPSLSSF